MQLSTSSGWMKFGLGSFGLRPMVNGAMNLGFRSVPFFVGDYQAINVRLLEWNFCLATHFGHVATFNENLRKHSSVLKMDSCNPIPHPCFGLALEIIGMSVFS